MKTVFSIGEALIDFIPDKKGIPLKEVTTFMKAPGGAPANVACCVAKLGGKSAFIGKLGNDAFGDFLIETIKENNVMTNYIFQTDEANTALAFVALKKDGNRDFSFYRNPSADMLLKADEINEDWFNEDILHFCSVDLIEAPVKYAHLKVIESMIQKGGIISFDPNVRLPLWDSIEECRKTILDFIPKADIVKISDEELEFITGISDTKEAIKSLFVDRVEMVIYTQGKDGATIYTKHNSTHVKGFKVDTVDTTGAGDAFIGAILYLISLKNIDIKNISQKQATSLLIFGNAVGALTASKKGAISALPSLEDVENFLRCNKE